MKHNSGYIAISSILVISVVVFIVGTSVSLLAINDIQSSLSYQKSQAALNLVEGCVNEALLYLNENNALPSTISLPEGNCSVTLNTQVGTNWTLTVAGTFEGYTKSIQVSATRSDAVYITGWIQL